MELIDKIRSVRWKYAKTYSEKLPHEYILRAQHPELYQEIADKVKTDGTDEPFFKTKFRYYYLGSYKYWVYTNIVNRTRIDGYSPVLKKKLLRILWVDGEV